MEKFDTPAVCQIGVIVPDAKKAAEKACQILGLEMVEISRFGKHGGYEHCNTKFHGEPTDGSGKNYCFKMGAIEVEFIEPVGDEPSTWKEFLDEHPNGGIHHIAWPVSDSDKIAEFMKSIGIEKLQEGCWETGRYTYYDVKDMGMIMETLEFFDAPKSED
jgi:methylmalonyl-CoA/ethylmalonyl-CoA epimerase